MDDNALAHHGVKGMKWGIRRTPTQLARAAGRPVPKKAKRSVSKPVVKADKPAAAPKKSVKELSDEELRARINRLELEKKYKDLSSESAKKSVSKGKEFCMRVLESIGEKTLVNLGTQAANHFGGEAINKLFGVSSDDTAKRIVNPQKGQTDKK